MTKLRVLVLAPDANPDSISTALVGYAHSEALARHHTVTLVVRSGNETAIRRVARPFHQVVGISAPHVDAVYAWSLRRLFRYDYGSHALTAFTYPFAVAFEWHAWRQMRARILAGEFDVVLRLLPVTSVLPSACAFFLRKTPVPFVVGPVNGGLPWPAGFAQSEKQREWISGLRNVYRILPFSRSTFRYAAAIIAGSSQTCAEFGAYRDKTFFVPENGISDHHLPHIPRPARAGALQLVFVGRLVPYKACDLALRAAAPLLRDRRAVLTIVGDGVDRTALEGLAASLGVSSAVSFCGWLSHEDTLARMRAADVLVFPSLREFGGGVVFEALAMGVVPVVAAFGGPGDIVHPAVGFSVPLTTPDDVVARMTTVLTELEQDPEHLRRMSERGMQYAREHLTWDGKARTVANILAWTAGKGPKPTLPPPRRDGADVGTPAMAVV